MNIEEKYIYHSCGTRFLFRRSWDLVFMILFLHLQCRRLIALALYVNWLKYGYTTRTSMLRYTAGRTQWKKPGWYPGMVPVGTMSFGTTTKIYRPKQQLALHTPPALSPSPEFGAHSESSQLPVLGSYRALCTAKRPSRSDLPNCNRRKRAFGRIGYQFLVSKRENGTELCCC